MIKVRDLLKKKQQKVVFSVASTDSVQTILEMMLANTIRSVVVLEQERLIGIVSERDCALKVLFRNRKASETTAAEIMTRDVFTVTGEETIDACMLMMSSKNIRHLPVCNNGKVVGMVSVGDVVKEVICHQTELITYLEGYIRGNSVNAY
ncbi:MAG: histidine kinase [Burkholderiales bacterium PBB1]|jgi:CBS domain-containing protein|nr:MAG: histidine kinase [Burkholderiales bacterium PBB1]